MQESEPAGGPAPFDPTALDGSTIAIPLLDEMRAAGDREFLHVTIDLNLRHDGGLAAARAVVQVLLLGHRRFARHRPAGEVVDHVETLGSRARDDRAAAPDLTAPTVAHLRHVHDDLGDDSDLGALDWPIDLTVWPGIVLPRLPGRRLDEVVDREKGHYTPQYVHARLTKDEVRALVELDQHTAGHAAIYKVWPDFPVASLVTRSVRTVKADAARIAFSAAGDGIVWAVADTGIDGEHAHFETHHNLDLGDLAPIAHQDFVDSEGDPSGSPKDPNGHGTHVAGIIAGESPIALRPGGDDEWAPARFAATTRRDAVGEVSISRWQLREPVAGVAPSTKLVSLRVLDEHGQGRVSNLLAAIGYVQQVNDHGRWIRIHGVNMSVGYGFDPEWFACGQSPLCVEVDRLVSSGVSVVVAAGNTGYWSRGGAESVMNAGLDLTINDPGNAELAITVGATHRDEPHRYGVSYFSSKGPTGDGRLKPDLIAPGERILSAAAGERLRTLRDELGEDGEVHYREESGTSMAAPHVSGAIAAFLSIRPEFVGHPIRLKEIFLDSATDLGRERYFQGRGLVDLMRAIQSV